MSEQEKLIFKNVKASTAQARARKLIISSRNGKANTSYSTKSAAA
ncbi:MAG: hypothetical protein ACJAXS_001639 [Colwellia sp.]|jgi:hypothetical protein